MAKRHLLTFLALVMLSFNAFSQTQPQEPQGGGTEQDPYLISTASEFLWITNDNDAYYKQTADINLGDLGQKSAAIISSFSGTYDGNGHTITYQASFNASTQGGYGLFGSVSGTIKNLTVDASATFGGASNFINFGLLCGTLDSSGLLQSCNVTGIINSTALSNNGSGTDSGLLVGESSGTIKYCIANGSVAGLGHVGGLIGRMYDGSVLGSAFTGSLYAIAPDKANGDHSYGSIAGGICGAVQAGSSINSCFVDADIVAEYANSDKIPCLPYGIAYDNTEDISVVNNYCEGTLNGEPIDAHADVTNSTNTNNNSNYYPGYGGMTNQQIVDSLNGAIPNNDPNINFGLTDDGDGDGDGDEVIFGVVSTDIVCETPTNLTITNNAGAFTASWTSANANNTITESHWHWSLTGGDAYDDRGEASSTSVDLGTLPASSTPYTFMVYTDCSETVNGLTSYAFSKQFPVDCPAPTNLTASNITDNGFTISWNADVECQVSFNGNEEIILSSQEKTKSFEGLNPETQYTAIVKAKCGNAYVEQASINVTTARLTAPTGLAVNTVWNGSVGSGTATITWDMVDGLTYEYEIEKEGEAEPEAGNTESVFEKTGLSEGAYTLKLRAKKGEKTSEWVSMPYTISSPDAPKNPQVEYTINGNGNSYDVTVSWTAGSTENDGWKVNGGEVQNTASYVLTAQTPGYVTTLSIVEKVEESTSGALQVPIQVPCLPATLPNDVSTTQTSATFTFSQAIEGRKVIIGSNEYDASETIITIDELTSGTTYSYEVREYCNETQYSSVIANFATVGCFAVKNLSVSDIGVTNATISWESQSTLAGLNYQITVNGETKPEQTDKTITLTGLTSATEYTIVVKEQCGEDWGEGRTITFTTQGAKTYISAKTGNFSDGATWIGGQIPSIEASETASITINAGHTVTLDVTFVLRNNITFTNNGVLSIGQTGELINTTNNNVGGIVEVVTPIKTMGKWTFIGAPFENYKLETIKPVSGSDISVSLYDYEATNWDDEWAHYNTTVGRGDGYFAWPFYGGAVTYTTYGDLFVWNAEGTSGTIMTSYDFSQPAKYQLNNAETFTVTKNVQGENERWMALSNPYPAKLIISKNDIYTEKEDYESMVQRVYRQILSVDEKATVTIATSKTQVSSIHNQLGSGVGICVEPCRRDTFPAIALATAYLHDVKGISEEEAEFSFTRNTSGISSLPSLVCMGSLVP